MKTTTRTVNVVELKTNLFVRQSLDQEHVLHLADLMENGIKMNDLIEVTDMRCPNEVVNGRHRKEAYELNKTETVQVKVLEFDDEAEMVAYAYKANAGGSKPPTPADTEHTVMVLLNQGTAKKRIPELLGLPAKMVQRYVDNVASKMARAKLQRAIDDFTEKNLTMAQAAEQNGVDVEKLKETLSRTRRRAKNGIPEMQKDLTRRQKASASKLTAVCKKLAQEYQEGDVSKKQILTILEQVKKHQKLTTRTISDWEARFNALFNGEDEAKAKSA